MESKRKPVVYLASVGLLLLAIHTAIRNHEDKPLLLRNIIQFTSYTLILIALGLHFFYRYKKGNRSE